jgi:hypothetical protein
MWLAAQEVEALVGTHAVARGLSGKAVFRACGGGYLEWDGREFVAMVVLDPPMRIEGGDDVYFANRVWCVQTLCTSCVIVSDRRSFVSVGADKWRGLRLVPLHVALRW